jgi:hypothetical protein
VEQGWFQGYPTDRTSERIGSYLLNATATTRFAQMTGQMVQKSFVEGGEAKREGHQVRMKGRVERVKRATVFSGLECIVLEFIHFYPQFPRSFTKGLTILKVTFFYADTRELSRSSSGLKK